MRFENCPKRWERHAPLDDMAGMPRHRRRHILGNMAGSPVSFGMERNPAGCMSNVPIADFPGGKRQRPRHATTPVGYWDCRTLEPAETPPDAAAQIADLLHKRRLVGQLLAWLWRGRSLAFSLSPGRGPRNRKIAHCRLPVG